MTPPARPGEAGPDTTAVPEVSLRRELGLHHLTAIGVNVCIGGSIFLIGADAFRLAGGWSLVLVGAVGAFALVMGLIFAEVSSRFDATGGPYLYAREAFGPFVGFEVAWMMWFTRVLAQASLTNGILVSLAYYLDGPLPPAPRAALILAITLAITALHLRGIRQGAGTILVFAVVKLLPIALVLTLGSVVLLDKPVELGAPPAASDMLATVLLLLFSLGGYEVIPVTAGEARNPKRDAPLATLSSILVMIVVWLLLQTILIQTLPMLAAETRPVAAAAQALGGAGAGHLVNMGAILSAIGTCIGTLLTASRSLYAVGGDRLVPDWFAHVDPKTRVPDRAIWFSTAIALLLALSGSFVFLAAAAAIPRIVIYLVVAASLIRFRRLDGGCGAPPASFRLIGGGGFAMSVIVACMLVLSGVSTAQLLLGIGGIAAGAILYTVSRYGRRNA